MAKLADYGISIVKYTKEKTHIDKALVHEYLDTGFSLGEEWTREKVVSAIGEGFRFATILKRKGQWLKDREVGILTVDKMEYIRTDNNEKARDNLENLPELIVVRMKR